MTFSRPIRTGVVAAFIFLLAAAFVAGNPQQSFAEPLGSDIVCHVFTTLTDLGDPIPVLNGGDCPDQPPPPPPPPPPLAACADGIDNDTDGLIDMADPGCADTSDNDESDAPPPPPPNPPAPPQCSDGADNEGDSLIDTLDPACHTDFNAENAGSYDPSRTDESAVAPSAPQCSDGLDNDGDGLTDTADPGCTDTSDTDEADPSSGDGSPSTGSGSSSGGGGGGGGGKKTVATSTATTTGIVLGISTQFSTTTESCDRYLTAFIREGKENDTDQVKRLQRFLRDFEGTQVSETGTYDKATLAAVHAFQTKYASDILTPWGIKESTGYVYLTTRKKVNEIFCGFTKIFFLTMEEQRKIDDARSGTISALTPAAPAKMQNAAKIVPKTTQTTATATTSSSQGQSPLERTLRFLRGLFNR